MLYLGIARADKIHEKYEELLSPAEKERMSKIKRGARRDEYLTSRALLYIMRRDILGAYGGELSYNENGKPYFEGQQDFSISHSDKMCAVLISDENGITVGLDVQKNVEDEEKASRIGKRFFKYLNEQMMENTPTGLKFLCYGLDGYPPRKEYQELKDAKNEGFTYAWTRLEAFLKMRGTGFCHLEENEQKKYQITSYEYMDYTISVSQQEAKKD